MCYEASNKAQKHELPVDRVHPGSTKWSIKNGRFRSLGLVTNSADFPNDNHEGAARAGSPTRCFMLALSTNRRNSRPGLCIDNEMGPEISVEADGPRAFTWNDRVLAPQQI
jgi:hypothetical protein